jgi:hypothetical protein
LAELRAHLRSAGQDLHAAIAQGAIGAVRDQAGEELRFLARPWR